MTTIWKLRIRPQCECYIQLKCRYYQFRNVTVKSNVKKRLLLGSKISVGRYVVWKKIVPGHYNAKWFGLSQ